MALRKRAYDMDEDGGRIEVRVSDFAHGVRIFQRVQLVRIKSDTYSITVMSDHVPLLGGVRGHVELLSEGRLISLGEVAGFYMHRNNSFSLLIDEQLSDAQEAPAARET